MESHFYSYYLTKKHSNDLNLVANPWFSFMNGIRILLILKAVVKDI
jgi:hypothetical protein